MTPDLQAGEFTLRALVPEDAGRVHALVNDWSVVRMLSRPPFPYPRDLTDDWIAETIRASAEARGHHFAVTLADGTLVGCIGLRIEQRRATLGYWIGRAFWGRGIAMACVRRVVHWAFATQAIDTLEAQAAIDNAASIAILQRNGFRETGTGVQRFVSRGGDHPVRQFAATRADLAPAPHPSPEDGTPRRMVTVAAAALIDAEGRVLLARRPEGKPLAGLWEFPGGKLESGEAPVAALRRELHEELGLDLGRTCLAPLSFVSQPVGAVDLLLLLYVGRIGRLVPHGREGQALAWVPPQDLARYDMPAPDLPLLPVLLELLGPAPDGP